MPGPERSRTADFLLAKQALYQLSYRPSFRHMLQATSYTKLYIVCLCGLATD